MLDENSNGKKREIKSKGIRVNKKGNLVLDKRHTSFYYKVQPAEVEECMADGETQCECAKCEKSYQEEMAFHRWEYEVYGRKDEDGHTYDIRDVNPSTINKLNLD